MVEVTYEIRYGSNKSLPAFKLEFSDKQIEDGEHLLTLKHFVTEGVIVDVNTEKVIVSPVNFGVEYRMFPASRIDWIDFEIKAS